MSSAPDLDCEQPDQARTSPRACGSDLHPPIILIAVSRISRLLFIIPSPPAGIAFHGFLSTLRNRVASIQVDCVLTRGNGGAST